MPPVALPSRWLPRGRARLAGLALLAVATTAGAGCAGATTAPARPADPASGTAPHPSASPAPLSDPAALIRRVAAHYPAVYRFALAHGAQVLADPATGGFTVHSTRPARPGALIVVLHGHNSNTFREWTAWEPYAAAHGYGLVTVEWQLRFGRDTSFLDPQTLYDLIVRTVRAVGVAPGHVLLHGFSQGSHEVFGLTQLDRAGARIVGLTLAESGGTRDTTPVASLAGSRWVLYCAGRDQYAYLTGCGRMRQSAAFLRASGARVDRFLVNPTGRHGSLLYDPPLVESALADFATILAGR